MGKIKNDQTKEGGETKRGREKGDGQKDFQTKKGKGGRRRTDRWELDGVRD